jgi:hypothetical protein
MSLTWAVEALPTVTSAPPVLTASKTYEFILELDAAGNVLGGEWLNSSKNDHPPFFWAPLGPGSEVPNLNPSYVKALLSVSNM